MYAIISSASNNTLTSSFPICNFLISFSYLIALAKTSSTILNRWRNRTTLSCPDFSGFALSLSPFNLALVIGLMCLVFIMSRYAPHVSNCSGLLSWKNVGFCQRPFMHLMRWLCGILSFMLFLWWIIFTDFPILKHPCISGMKPSWSWWVVFLLCSWIWFASILLSIFATV